MVALLRLQLFRSLVFQTIHYRQNQLYQRSQPKRGQAYSFIHGCKWLFQNAFQELHELYKNKCKAEENEDKSKIISIDTEIILEINNLCHFNEPRKMYGLFKKYLLIYKIENQWGHKHLYKDYQMLVDVLEMNICREL